MSYFQLSLKKVKRTRGQEAPLEEMSSTTQLDTGQPSKPKPLR